MQRRADLDQAKGLAILLVVFGHIVARADPAGVEWYEPLRRAVYTFHMPFFLYLSGMAAAQSGALLRPPAAWPALFRARGERLLLPFFGLGFGIVLAKCAAAPYMFVDNPPAGLLAGITALLWRTATSPAMSVWYLFVLFVLSCAAPVLVHLNRGRLRLMLVSCLILYILPLPACLYADHVGRYAIFFALGAWAGGRAAAWTHFIDRAWPALAVPFAAALGLVIRHGGAWPRTPELLLIGSLSMPVLHGLVRNSPHNITRCFFWLGRYSFMIYLFNTLFIGLTKALLLRVTDWDAPHFLPFAMVLMLSGVFGPIGLKQLALRRGKIMDRAPN